MARSDLLVSLVQAGTSGDKKALASVVEAIVAEERSKQHNVLAERLTRALRSDGNGGHTGFVAAEPGIRARDYVLEVTPRKRLEDLILSDLCERACRELIEEQQRAGPLRSHSLEPRHRVLLVGPPGNGKTSLAEAIAEALAVQFFVCSLRCDHRQFPRRDGEPSEARLRLCADDAVRPFFRRVRCRGQGARRRERNGRNQARGDVVVDADR